MDAEHVRSEIEAEYRRRADILGWRLLCSPWQTTSKADVAFIGLNPGGRIVPRGHGELSTEGGSAYEIEEWAGYPKGESPLQQQVRALCDLAEVEPRLVLAGNLVPFRSPDWKSLRGADSAVKFGLMLWERLLSEARPRLVIAMGSTVQQALCKHFIGSGVPESTLAGWGKLRIFRADHRAFRLVGLPHLSRFRIINRPKSLPALRWALDFDR